MNRKTIFFLSLLLLFGASPAFGCDLCAIYNSIDSSQPNPGTYRLGIAEQFTKFDKIQVDGNHIDNEANQSLESSISQLFGIFDLNKVVSFQLTLPYINRRFKRFENSETERGTEAGIGDVSLLAEYIAYELRDQNTTFYVQLFGGIKLPTGDSDRLNEEGNHDNDHQDVSKHTRLLKHAGEDHGEDNGILSSIHGHDLALGSGSYDFPIGMNFFAQHDRIFAAGSLQYIIRSEGDFDYRYADDLLWDIGPGYYMILRGEYTISLKANLSGEYKKRDKQNGALEQDTGIRSTFLGPRLIFTAGNWTGDLGWDIPLDINNTGIQSVINDRLRAAIYYRF